MNFNPRGVEFNRKGYMEDGFRSEPGESQQEYFGMTTGRKAIGLSEEIKKNEPGLHSELVLSGTRHQTADMLSKQSGDMAFQQAMAQNTALNVTKDEKIKQIQNLKKQISDLENKILEIAKGL